jgi:hypothetical protein
MVPLEYIYGETDGAHIQTISRTIGYLRLETASTTTEPRPINGSKIAYATPK